jgi:hypothetical protein
MSEVEVLLDLTLEQALRRVPGSAVVEQALEGVAL